MEAMGRSLCLLSALLLACGSDVELPGSGGAGGGASVGPGGSSADGGTTSSSPSGPGTGTGTGAGTTSTGTSTSTSTGTSSTSTGSVVCSAFGQCPDCVSQACPEVWCDCVGNVQCSQIFQCTADCAGDAACLQGCMAMYPDGISVAILVNDCASTTCADSCPNAHGDPLDPCETCLYSTCPEAMNACLSEPECLTLWSCLTACGQNDLSCHNDCYNAHPDGIPPLEGILDCSTMSCGDSCN